ncbi:hypothetical protein BST_1168 [Bacillus stercoris]
MKKIAAYYLMTLGLSSLTFGLFFGLYSFVMYGDMIIALFTAAIALLYAFMMYGLFAVPLQNDVAEKSGNIQCHVSIDLQCDCFYRGFPVIFYW